MKIYSINERDDYYSNKEDEWITLHPDYHNNISDINTDDFDVFLVFGRYEEFVGEPIKILGVYTTFEGAHARQKNENLSIRDEYFLTRITLLKWGQPFEESPQFVR